MNENEEPLYVYVKGQGWIVKPKLLVQDQSGRMLRLEKRPPKKGERFFHGYGCDEKHDARNMQHASQFRYEQFSQCIVDFDEDEYCITLVVV